MLKEVSESTWVDSTKDSESYSVFTEPRFLKPISEVLGYSLKYYIYYLKAKPVIGFSCFVKGKKIKVPTHFIYSGLWYNIPTHTIKFRDLLIDSVKELKKKYTAIEFRFPPSFTDIRPFQWEGFTYSLNYTYVKSLQELNFEYNIRSRVQKAQDIGIVLSNSLSFEAVWSHQNADFKRFNFPDYRLGKLERLFKNWHKAGFMQIYEAKHKGIIIGSSCVLIDPASSVAYNLLISSANSNYQTGVHAALYSFICNQLNLNNIKTFDLFGADIKGVADFKSSLGASLHAHYTVKYSRNNSILRQLVDKLKFIGIRLRSRFF